MRSLASAKVVVYVPVPVNVRIPYGVDHEVEGEPPPLEPLG
jgi:hypothetical protein